MRHACIHGGGFAGLQWTKDKGMTLLTTALFVLAEFAGLRLRKPLDRRAWGFTVAGVETHA